MSLAKSKFPNESPPKPDSGIYIAIFYMPEDQEIHVGRLGSFYFREGIYFYVGSARRNMSARLERHSKKNKPLNWHIDYLSNKSDMLGAIVIPGQQTHECEVACELGKMFELPVSGFGASDCNCTGHLFYSPQLP
jgi:sugar fermentation stimulation protein A